MDDVKYYIRDLNQIDTLYRSYWDGDMFYFQWRDGLVGHWHNLFNNNDPRIIENYKKHMLRADYIEITKAEAFLHILSNS